MSKTTAKEPSKGGMPRFVPTEDERALVKLLIASGYAQHLVCPCISNRRGSHISESTLKRAFAHELEVGKVEVVMMVLRQFMAAIDRGERWAIRPAGEIVPVAILRDAVLCTAPQDEA